MSPGRVFAWGYAGLCLGMAPASAPAETSGEPGWLRHRECLVAAAATAGAESTAMRDSGGYEDSAAAMAATLTLKPLRGLGSVARLRVERNGLRLLPGQDYGVLPGDSVLLFPAPPSPGDTLCVERAESPLLSGAPRLYRLEHIPVFDPGGLDSAWKTATAGLNMAGPAQLREDSGASRYRLNYSGSKSMAVSVGSGGGLGLDAALFINLNGQVSENVFVEGQLSDQNVPVQPEGNTATLKEVDTKFMRVYGSNYSYSLGNYLMDYGVAGEDRYTAKVQGVNGLYRLGEYSLHATLSLSEGQYQSDTLRGVDGKQRGYYLRGKDGRQFITVLAGTERVWRNGQPLRRGADYSIDYSEGRIDFLNPVVVTSENLFSAEFQYTEQDFGRTLGSGEIRDTAGNFNWSVRTIVEREDRDNPLNALLDPKLRPRYAGLGDSVFRDSLGRLVRMPQQQAAAAANLAWTGAGHSSRGSLLWSQLDKNLYSGRDDVDNLGFSTRYLGSQALGMPLNQGGWGQTAFFLDHDFRDSHFEPFKQLVEPRGFQEIWNLDARVAQRGFMANRLRVEEKPLTYLLLGGEAGRADADLAADTSAGAARGSLSRRGSLFARLGGEKTFAEASSEAKFARSPLRRDNYRQSAQARWQAGKVSPSLAWTRNEWLTQLPAALGRSVKEEPSANLATLPLAGRVTLNTGFSLISQRSDFDGRLPGLQDSARDWGVSQKVEAFGMGPWSSDAFYSYRNHRQWRLDRSFGYSTLPEENDFNQVEWNNQLNDHRRGYALSTGYRVNQTAEIPLVEAFEKVPAGRGNYVYDSLLNVYHEVETGGDYVLVGLQRDTLQGSRPYQDLMWNANLELTPSKFPFAVKGVLADISLSFDMSLDHQDTSGRAGLLPLFTDAQIEKMRGGRSSYGPALHWQDAGGRKSANMRVSRMYNHSSGVYAARERLWDERGDFRQEVGEDWEYALEQAYEIRTRQGLSPGSPGRSDNENNTYGFRVTRKLPQALALEGRAQYLTSQGNATGGSTDLQGLRPALKLEKSSLYNGRAFLEYGVIYFWGRGEGGYYTTGSFRRGLTHRAQANANFQLGQNMYVNFDYVLRLEPGSNRPVHKLTAEARAVF